MPFQFGTSKFIVTVTITVANTGVQNFWGGPVIGGQWIVDAISFQKICGSYSPIHDTKDTDGNVKIVLESSKQDSQLVKSTPNVYLVILPCVSCSNCVEEVSENT